MISTHVRRQWTLQGGLSAEVALQATLCGLAGLLAIVLKQAGMASVDHAFTVLGSSIAIAAAILLTLGAWLSTNGPAIRLAFAVAMYGVFLLAKAVGPEPTADGRLARDLAMIGVAALCGLTLRGIDVVDRAWHASAPVSAVVLVGCAIVSLVPAATLTPTVQSAVTIGAGVVTAAVGITLLAFGVRGDQSLLRAAGLSLLTLSAQSSPVGNAFRLAAITMLLITSVPMVVRALRAVWREQAESQFRLQAAAQAMACSAVRDHEMRNLVAGLSGAVTVLTAVEATGEAAGDRGHLGAATRIELDRLRRMLDTDSALLTSTRPYTVAVGPLLSGLAALHGSPGTSIEVTVTDDPLAAMPSDGLAHIVTNLLVNCTKHAPGARVWLTACRHADRVVIEVTDDGPGLPPGLTTELLQPGMRGPSSTGTGLGLHVSAELIGRHGGMIRLAPALAGGRGCTVTVELPAATADGWLREHVAV